MLRFAILMTALMSALPGGAAMAQDALPQLSGQVRLQWDDVQANTAGPLAASHALQSSIADLPTSGATLQTELRASGKGITGVLTLQQQRDDGQATDSNAWFNELYASHDAGAWQFSAGKKIVAWDVGYGYRPNDMVQQETRRTLISNTPEGRPLLLAEHFTDNTAWSLVWVNPTASSDTWGAQEPALAARLYQRSGAADWYGFARVGAHTGGSLGAALAWVATDALELHSSLRYAERVDSTVMRPTASGLLTSNPWQLASVPHVAQWLLGGTWTNESQLSLLFEAWWDGSAPSDAQWQTWSARNRQLSSLADLGASAAVAGNLAWQTQILGTDTNLQRRNLYLRLSWDHEGWQPTLDLLYHPLDGGRMVTAALLYKGNRVQVQGGLRQYGGPAQSVLAQLPTRRQAYLALTWVF
ncbi:hypothetical protein [Rhodoferax sp.]|uniref:hypothetical protein n=1 Tax=Rhodoferax sp. TaxID=50421 RepID=UPI00283DA795|nr:hypothetical protein [Rhodoferax sp.]MDR3367636.1 hypothetical protein [Rhodoferax sp.]